MLLRLNLPDRALDAGHGEAELFRTELIGSDALYGSLLGRHRADARLARESVLHPLGFRAFLGAFVVENAR